MNPSVDVLLITAADGEDDAVRAVDDGALGPWTEVPGPDGYGFAIWVREYRSAQGDPIRIALTRAFQMGVAASGNAAARLTDFFKPRCLAMCGVCAGHPGRTMLGDVIVADRLWSYDVGDEFNAIPGAKPRFRPDTLQVPFRPQWAQAALRFALPTRDQLIGERPRPRDLQALWVLKQLLDGIDPADAAGCERMCADWAEVIGGLKKQKRIAVKGGKPGMTKAGRELIENTLYEHGGQLPAQPDWQIHVGPLGTGSKLVRDVDIWNCLEDQQRQVRGLDMEGSVIALTALVQDVPRMIVVKGVMDFGGPDRNFGFREFAARAAAEVLIAFLREHLEPAQRTPQLSANTWKLPDNPSPAQLLNARYQTVTFNHDARAELWCDLERWCKHPEPVGVRLFTGPGGSGKTRLFIEFAGHLRDEGWQAGFWPDGAEAEQWGALLASRTATMVVIDYAEARNDLSDMLKRVATCAANAGCAAPFRVVLLAREVADWWRSLLQRDAEVDGLLTRHEPAEVSLIPFDGPLRTRLFEEARDRFAELRGVKVPARPVDLSDERFGRLLYLHMAALAVVDELEPAADELLDGVVDREQHFWKHAFTQELPAGDRAQAEFIEAAARTVAALTLRGGAASADEAEAINRFAKGPVLHGFVRFLHSLYPGRTAMGGVGRYVGSLEPDAVGEQLVARVLGDAHTPGTYVTDVVRDADRQALPSAFIVLGRVSLREPGVGVWIERLLDEDINGRAPAAFFAAVALSLDSAHVELGRLLAERLKVKGTDDFARLIDAVLPGRGVSLSELRVWAARRLLATIAADSVDRAAQKERARLLLQLGGALHASAAYNEALQVTCEAVETYRSLAVAEPESFLPDLGGGLNNFAVALHSLGRYAEALETARESVGVFKRLESSTPGAFLDNLATSVTNLGNALSALGEHEAALDAAREAVAYYRSLAAAGGDTVLPELAIGLNNLGNKLRRVGEHEQSLGVLREAVDIRRRLATEWADAFLADLATSVSNMGSVLMSLNRLGEAREALGEAVQLRRRLAHGRPDAFLADLASSLADFGSCLSDLGQNEEALRVAKEAAAHIRAATAVRPGALLPLLAMCLDRLGDILCAAGQHEDALVVADELVGTRRNLAAAESKSARGDFAASLLNLGALLRRLDRRGEALVAMREAVECYRNLAAAGDEAFLSLLLMGLETVGNTLGELERHDEALEATEEAVTCARRLLLARPDVFLPVLTMELCTLCERLRSVGERDKALDAASEAVQYGRQLVVVQPDVFLPHLAGSLNYLSAALSDVGERRKALDASREAVELYRKLAVARPDVFRAGLAGSLNNLGATLSALGRREGALEAAREAVEHQRELAGQRSDVLVSDLAVSLDNLGNWLSDAGRHEEALKAAEEAVDCGRKVATARPGASLSNLAGSLLNLGARLIESGRYDEALAATREAAEHYRKLTAQTPGAFAPRMAASLNNLAHILGTLGMREESLGAAREAVGLYLEVVRTAPARYLGECRAAVGNLVTCLARSDGCDWAGDALVREAIELLNRYGVEGGRGETGDASANGAPGA